MREQCVQAGFRRPPRDDRSSTIEWQAPSYAFCYRITFSCFLVSLSLPNYSAAWLESSSPGNHVTYTTASWLTITTLTRFFFFLFNKNTGVLVRGLTNAESVRVRQHGNSSSVPDGTPLSKRTIGEGRNAESSRFPRDQNWESWPGSAPQRRSG